jgi:hypothetical protein
MAKATTGCDVPPKMAMQMLTSSMYRQSVHDFDDKHQDVILLPRRIGKSAINAITRCQCADRPMRWNSPRKDRLRMSRHVSVRQISSAELRGCSMKIMESFTGVSFSGKVTVPSFASWSDPVRRFLPGEDFA